MISFVNLRIKNSKTNFLKEVGLVPLFRKKAKIGISSVNPRKSVIDKKVPISDGLNQI